MDPPVFLGKERRHISRGALGADAISEKSAADKAGKENAEEHCGERGGQRVPRFCYADRGKINRYDVDYGV